MTPEALRAVFIAELVRVAPDIEPATVHDDDHLQDDLELDSMDFLNLVSALHRRLGVDVAESDYARLATTGSAVPFLLARLG